MKVEKIKQQAINNKRSYWFTINNSRFIVDEKGTIEPRDPGDEAEIEQFGPIFRVANLKKSAETQNKSIKFYTDMDDTDFTVDKNGNIEPYDLDDYVIVHKEEGVDLSNYRQNQEYLNQRWGGGGKTHPEISRRQKTRRQKTPHPTRQKIMHKQFYLQK